MMLIIRKTIITIYFWTIIAITNLIATIIIIPYWLVGGSQKEIRGIIEMVTAKFPTQIMRLSGIWSVEYIDRREEKKYYKGSYVIVSNHVSLIDTMFIAQLPFDKIFTWKKKWSYLPMFGQICLMAGHITIDPSCPTSKRNAITKSETYLGIGSSIIFYPEGTRSKCEGKLLPFRTGAFRVAKSSHKKILPVTLVGTNKGCNGWVCDVASIKIIIDDPIIVSDTDISIQKVRAIMEENYQEYHEI